MVSGVAATDRQVAHALDQTVDEKDLVVSQWSSLLAEKVAQAVNVGLASMALMSDRFGSFGLWTRHLRRLQKGKEETNGIVRIHGLDTTNVGAHVRSRGCTPLECRITSHCTNIK